MHGISFICKLVIRLFVIRKSTFYTSSKNQELRKSGLEAPLYVYV